MDDIRTRGDYSCVLSKNDIGELRIVYVILTDWHTDDMHTF